nr:chromatin modification-related protein MEAF6-like isoform X2 [Ipomoea batatas]
METSYLQDPSQCGNVLKGFEGFLSSSKSTTLLKRSRKFQPDDRLFSLSSVTSPAVCYITYSYSMMVLSMSFVL